MQVDYDAEDAVDVGGVLRHYLWQKQQKGVMIAVVGGSNNSNSCCEMAVVMASGNMQ